MAARLARNGAVLLFAEGHRDLGSHVLPFRSALIGAAQAAMNEAGAKGVAIQPVTISYTRLQGMPVSRADRSLISGIAAKSFGEVVRTLLTSGSKTVCIAFGTPRPIGPEDDRKVATRQAEDEVRRMLVALNRGENLPVPEPAASSSAPARRVPA
jgi:1-acyl-sn-glycerol-3-phosphate acyltransferase